MSVDDPSTWPEFAKIDPELDVIIKAAAGRGPPPLTEDSDIIKVRAGMAHGLAAAAKAAPPPDYSGLKKSRIEIPVRDGSSIDSILYQPEPPSEGGNPLVLLFHAGGFCMGIPEMMEPLALELVKSHGAVVISVGYRLAPERPFPGAVEDAYDALKWSASNASKLNVNLEAGFIVGGDSAGATLSAVSAHLARDESLSPSLTGVWLNIPSTVAAGAVPDKYKDEHTSRTQNKNAPFFDEAGDKFVNKQYNSVPTDPRASPLLWPGGHKGLPRHVIQAAGLDMLRDDALLYERELRSDGVSTRIHVYPGVTHAFDGMFPQLSKSAQHRKDRSEGFTWLLKK